MAGLTVTGRVAGDTAAVKLIVPENPLMLAMLSVDVAEDPAVIAILLGFAVRKKSGVVLVENVADSTSSGTAIVEPWATVTQTGGALVGAPRDTQLIWIPMLLGRGSPVTVFKRV